jgi:outer membrane protein OmpA-like peptidoglycan-associated protein
MVGKTKQGTTIRKDAANNVKMVLWKPAINEESIRYSILYEFNKSEAIAIYEKYLIEVVTPQIPKGARVIIHGYTDIIGDAENNKELSLARANDVRKIISATLAKAYRKDVIIDVYGFGEDEVLAPFENKYPEERSYNRSVIIDIIPRK